MQILRRWSNYLGVISIALSVLFWVYVRANFAPDALLGNVYVVFFTLWGLIALAAVTATLAGIGGTKLWFLALFGPVWGVMLMLSAAV